MAEVLVEFTVPIERDGKLYWPKALTRQAEDGLWEGWVEFAVSGDGEALSTSRETEQPSRDEVMYWATGLSATYLEGALDRALRPMPARAPIPERKFVDSAPRPPLRTSVPLSPRPVLDPFAVYAEGEQLLRRQLHALSHDHLQNIVEAYQLDADREAGWVRTAPDAALVDRIVEGVRERLELPISEPGTAREQEVVRRIATEPDLRA
jgi:hypothetical protein